MKSPKEIFENLAEYYSVITSTSTKHLGPGKIIEKLNKEKRDILSKLKSSEVSDVRDEFIKAIFSKSKLEKIYESIKSRS